jgi:hypothetical protein
LRLFNFVDKLLLLGANEEYIEDAADDDGKEETSTSQHHKGQVLSPRFVH